MPHCSVYRSPYADSTDLGKKFADELEKVVQKEGPDTVGGVILEPITAGGSVITPPEGYFERITEICKKYGLLLIIDEVVCGLGRTGKWFGYQHYNVQPDIVTMAKGVASGYAAISLSPLLYRPLKQRRANSPTGSPPALSREKGPHSLALFTSTARPLLWATTPGNRQDLRG